MNIDTERKEFEAWAKDRNLDLTPFGNTFDSDFTSNAWDGWQARAQQVQADAGAVAWRTGEIVWAVEEDAKRHAHWNKLTVEPLYSRPTAESDKRGNPWTDLLAYVLQDDLHNRLTPRVIDIAYTAFKSGAVGKTKGGPNDWMNDTKPRILDAIEKLRKDLYADRAAMSREKQGGE